MADSALTLQIVPGWSFPAASLISLHQDIFRRTGRIPRDHDHGLRVAMGWSLGGLQILRDVTTAEKRPPTHLILVASTARFCGDEPGWPGLSRAALRALQRQLARAPEEALAGFHRLCAGTPLTDEVLATRVAASLRLGLPALADGLRELAELDLRTNLSACDVPVLMLHGARDQVIPLAAAEQTAALLPQARLVVHPEAGHDLPLAHPHWVAEHVADFLHHSP